MNLTAAVGLWDPEPGWLNTASYGLPPRPAWDALQSALADWRVGHISWEGWDESTSRSRASFARLIGVPVEDVAVGSQVSTMLAPVVAALPPGARVVAPDVEFTSNLFPWLVRGDLKVETVPVDRLVEAVDRSVDVVAFSLVQSADGLVTDLSQVSAAAREAGALVVVDATQGCGWLPIDGTLADAVLVHAYKWLMSPRGSAFAYLGPRLRGRMTAGAAGWYAGEDVHSSYYGPPLRLAADARRFDTSPAWFSWVGTAPALELLEDIGVEQVHAHDVGLANRFRAGLGLPPGDSAIVSTDHPGAEERFARANIRAAVRAGRLRASFHLYSTVRDVDSALDALLG
jgi:selenocysteine lyase/cysteine desulfurase